MGLLLWDLHCRLMSCKTSHMFKSLYSLPPVYISVVNKAVARLAPIHLSSHLTGEMRLDLASDMIINIKALAPDVSTRCLSSRNIWSPGKLLHSPPLAAPPFPRSRESPARCVLLRVCSQVVAARRPYDDN